MLDAPVLKETLAATQADLTVMASSHVYDAIIRRAPGFVDRAAFRQVRYQVKEAKITSWMYPCRRRPQGYAARRYHAGARRPPGRLTRPTRYTTEGTPTSGVPLGPRSQQIAVNPAHRPLPY